MEVNRSVREMREGRREQFSAWGGHASPAGLRRKGTQAMTRRPSGADCRLCRRPSRKWGPVLRRRVLSLVTAGWPRKRGPGWWGPRKWVPG